MGFIQTSWANCQRFFSANYPYILTGIGVAGVVMTAWRAIEDTFKAEDALEEKIEEVGGRELTMKEKIITVAPCYISTAISAATSIACTIGGAVGSHRMAVVAAGLYEASEIRRRNLEAAMREKLGDEESRAISRLARGTVKNEQENGEPYVNIANEDQEVWFIDSFGQRFKATWRDVAEAETYICKLVMDQMCATVNDFYERLELSGVKVQTCDAGDACEWTVEYPPTITQSDECKLIDGVPHVVLQYETDPKSRWR